MCLYSFLVTVKTDLTTVVSVRVFLSNDVFSLFVFVVVLDTRQEFGRDVLIFLKVGYFPFLPIGQVLKVPCSLFPLRSLSSSSSSRAKVQAKVMFTCDWMRH